MSVDLAQIMRNVVRNGDIQALASQDDDYILTELNEISGGSWWGECVASEYDEVYWSVYYNRCEEIAIERGLI